MKSETTVTETVPPSEAVSPRVMRTLYERARALASPGKTVTARL